jgi:hypothetical protein
MNRPDKQTLAIWFIAGMAAALVIVKAGRISRATERASA